MVGRIMGGEVSSGSSTAAGEFAAAVPVRLESSCLPSELAPRK